MTLAGYSQCTTAVHTLKSPHSQTGMPVPRGAEET